MPARPKPVRAPRRKPNPLKQRGIEHVDWKDAALLRTFISDRGKIRARRVTGLTGQQQRRILRRDRPRGSGLRKGRITTKHSPPRNGEPMLLLHIYHIYQ